MSLDKVFPGKNVPDAFNVIIEIPMNADPIKYEVDKESGAIFVDRFMSTSMHYPTNYGYVPHTISGDGDPVDVLVITPVPLIPGVVVAPVDGQQRPEPALGLVESEQALGDVGQRLERDDVLAIQGKHVGERGLGGRKVAQVQMAAAEHDAGRDVVRVKREAGPEQLERPGDVPVLPMHLGKRRERQALGVFGVPALQLFDLAKCHPGSAFRGSEVPWGKRDRLACGEFRESSEPPPACQLLTIAQP